SAFIEDYNANANEELIMIGLADGLLDASYSLVHYTKERAAGQTDYFNEEVETLFQEAGRNLNDEERAKQYERIQAIVAEERPHIVLCQPAAYYGIRDDVQFTPNLNEVIFFDDMDKK